MRDVTEPLDTYIRSKRHALAELAPVLRTPHERALIREIDRILEVVKACSDRIQILQSEKAHQAKIHVTFKCGHGEILDPITVAVIQQRLCSLCSDVNGLFHQCVNG